MQEGTKGTPKTEPITDTIIKVEIYGWPFDYRLIQGFAHNHKISENEVIHLITSKLEWTGQFLLPESKQ